VGIVVIQLPPADQPDAPAPALRRYELTDSRGRPVPGATVTLQVSALAPESGPDSSLPTPPRLERRREERREGEMGKEGGGRRGERQGEELKREGGWGGWRRGGEAMRVR
jgi:hypothetical protein